MSSRIEVTGLDETIARLKDHPRQLARALRTTMEAALLTLWENVPGYPAKPETSTYRRTGTLGRSLGVSESGAQFGAPDIYEVKEHPGWLEATYGTRLEYAPYVIGDPQDEQASHMRHWWTLPVTVVNRSVKKIERLFVVMNENLARWLAGRGS